MMIKLLFIKYIKLKYKLFGNLNYYFLFLKNSIYEMKYIYIRQKIIIVLLHFPNEDIVLLIDLLMTNYHHNKTRKYYPTLFFFSFFTLNNFYIYIKL